MNLQLLLRDLDKLRIHWEHEVLAEDIEGRRDYLRGIVWGIKQTIKEVHRHLDKREAA